MVTVLCSMMMLSHVREVGSGLRVFLQPVAWLPTVFSDCACCRYTSISLHWPSLDGLQLNWSLYVYDLNLDAQVYLILLQRTLTPTLNETSNFHLDLDLHPYKDLCSICNIHTYQTHDPHGNRKKQGKKRGDGTLRVIFVLPLSKEKKGYSYHVHKR